MIKPLSPVENARPFFLVCDIENNPDGDMIDCDFCWRNDNGELEHKLFDDCENDWSKIWKWLISKARKDKRFRVLYAHNGGGWDWLSLVHWLLNQGKDEREIITANCAGSKMITMSVQIERRFTLHFCDSFQLLRSSLDKLSKTFLGQGKIDTSGLLPHELKQKDEDLYYDYLARDTENLLLVLEKSLEIIRENVAKIGSFSHTIGSTALKVFKTMSLNIEVSIPWDETVKDFLREGYRGGRVECFKPGYYDNVKVYDINSLYPYVMKTQKVPVSDRGEWVSSFHSGIPGAYRGKFVQHNTNIPPVLMSGGNGYYENKGVYFQPEIDLLKSVDPSAEIEIKTGYIFLDYDILFADYVEKLYNLRLTDKDGSLSLLCKFMLNSLYGKFGQHSEREKIQCFSYYDDFQAICEKAEIAKENKEKAYFPRPINDDLGIYGIIEDNDCAFEHVGIAGMITSGARVQLYKGMLNAGFKNVVYCDTDSVHVFNGRLDNSMVSNSLGKYKKEFEGEGVYAGKKLYGLRDSNGSEKIRAKGVSLGGRNGDNRINFDSLVSLLSGKLKRCEFNSPATPMQVFKGEKPCKFSGKHRTIRKLN